ncbi:ATP-binding cassette domain-containing protein [Candidatus Gracilibacteria bacterium]|nr:ATP-binding cassette domain-containing protein [Candidatus Gracilibacteria bacterium]
MFSIKITPAKFDYNHKTKVLDGHFLELMVKKTQKNKLYGIIGPSGTGKSTLISILGGQLNPQKGNVLIDGVDIYSVGDHSRRDLIALQMQTSTSLRGKLKYNLLFGLPDKAIEDCRYNDKYLVKLLKKVGLWDIFEPKEGLDTLIGEGGVNLSGGQRQRLNFAGLYLRARYFEPSLILIDEPTSSLDEISEKAITKMIKELSQDSLTLVVAHRLKTLDEAEAILDSSLFKSEKEMRFLKITELKMKSDYYKDLISGKAVLDG